MTANIALNACGGASDSMKIYYGKTTIVTGDPLTGTGWTLHTGAPLSAGTTSVVITGLDDNVQYTFYRYCHCPISGETDPEIQGPEIKYVCPTFQSTSSSSNQINYTILIPTSANNVGTWINKILVQVYDSTGTTLFSANTHNSPFSSSVSGSFLGLTASTTYRIKIKYSNAVGTVTHDCGFQDVMTQAPCVAPTVTSGDITYNSFEVAWSVPASFSGDNYSIVINSNTIASGLTIGSSPYLVTGLDPNTIYSVQVVRNCGFGGTSSSTPINITTDSAPAATINWSFSETGIGQGSFGITVNGSPQVSEISNSSGSFNVTNSPSTIGVVVSGQAGTARTLIVINDTTSTTLYNANSASTQSFSFQSVAGNSYTITGDVNG